MKIVNELRARWMESIGVSTATHIHQGDWMEGLTILRNTTSREEEINHAFNLLEKVEATL